MILHNFLKTSPSLLAWHEKAMESKQFWGLEKLSFAAKALFVAFAFYHFKKDVLIITSEKKEEIFFNNLLSMFKDNFFEFPSWEILPGEEISLSKDIIGRRLTILEKLSKKNFPSVVLTSLQSLMQQVVLKEKLKDQLEWKVSSSFSFSSLEKVLSDLGYKRVACVADKGEFAIRSGILDVFSLSHALPWRIEFFQDEISSIRTFDPASQKSIAKADRVHICFGDEKKILENSLEKASLLDYLSSDALIFFDDPVALEEQIILFKNISKKTPSTFFSADELFSFVQNHPKVLFANEEIEKLSPITRQKKLDRFFEELDISLFDQAITLKRFLHPFYDLDKYLSIFEAVISEKYFIDAINFLENKQIPISLLFETESEKRAMEDVLKHHNISLEKVTFREGYLSSAVVVSDIPFALIPFGTLKTKIKIHREENRLSYHTPLAEFHTLKEGDLVVHFHSGIGKYIGIEKVKDIKGEENEFFLIEYDAGGKLYVPLSQAHLLSRYIGTHDEHPPLDVLGSGRFTKTKAQAQRKILGYAKELLELYATRTSLKGFVYPQDSDDVKLFELDFPYQETLDQLHAIEDIKKDMESGKIMDRLLLGDVGYGKTEVAMRAAFKAVVDGKRQVAVLVPTTVLAMQHKETFLQRMINFPITIEAVSRFNTFRENGEILSRVSEGKVDILIGTHRMLSKDVAFKNLGLLIIDEEQRFGVRSKEKIKEWKKDVDCLTLSATPIPRTLYLSLVKARDMSVINTPPQDRLPIKTILAENEDTVIENALLRELLRGGQSFFIHNHVESIATRTNYLQKLVPKARFAIVHGQMDSDAIDNIFHEFKLGHTDVLVSTTILENGIDIPNANTIIVDQAHTFGLSDLYQLRGRVGRWIRMAYAYFLIPKKKELSDIAKKRLSALIESGGFGSGYKIAMKDLENRGAGDFLGEKQSGQVSAIGFHLYCKLLKQAVAALQAEQPLTFIETKIETIFPAKLPKDYIEEASLRMEIYHRLGAATQDSEIDEIISEVEDRFGPSPKEAHFLWSLAKIRVFAQKNQFTLLKFGDFTLLAKQRGPKEEIEKNLAYSKKFSHPKEWEEWTISTLKNSFQTQSESTSGKMRQKP